MEDEDVGPVGIGIVDIIPKYIHMKKPVDKNRISSFYRIKPN